ncbi:hypothetical protein F5Y16DRAFT_315844 [Xylariaceae sp. FL0255]|nr:hypothetical protein F5Y16DRAFT_315844 [Xylariaceae sp. FL0255]
MSAAVELVRRNWQMGHPPMVATKTEKPLVVGILGAADIAPQAFIIPIQTHPDVVLQTVAARSEDKARAYAKKHGIPDVAKSYQEILDDAKIDAVYIPLPNGLHYEWARRALKAGKHVLVEKPSVNNTIEAEQLFLSPNADPSSPQPVLLEATHYVFHPAWTAFMSHVTPSEVVAADSRLCVPSFLFGADDIRFKYDLGGGALMDLGAYTASVLVRVFGAVAEACESCDTVSVASDSHCDVSYRARFRFPGGGIGSMEGDLKGTITKLTPRLHVTHRAVAISAAEAGGNVTVKEGEEILRTRKVSFNNYMLPTSFHSIIVEDAFEIRAKVPGSTLPGPRKTWKTSKTVKAYTWREGAIPGTENQPGETYWSTYRHQLEQFVNQVRGREAAQWVTAQDSVNTMKMIDMAYGAAKMPLRPTSEYK